MTFTSFLPFRGFLLPIFRIRNPGKRNPRKGRKLVNVIPHRCGKTFFLLPYDTGCKWNIFLYGVLHFHIDYFEKLAAIIKVGKWCVDFVIDNGLSLPKTTTKFLNLIRALCHGEYKRKCKRIAPFFDSPQKICNIQLKGYTILWLHTVSDNLTVHSPIPCC